MPRRTGVFGGSFDPVHWGHLRAAEEAREALGLATVWFVPAANPPHKSDRALADAADRLRMVEIAVADHPAFRASAIEIERGGTSYSVDTLESIRALEPAAELFFLVGDDAFREIQTWRDCERLFEIAHIVVLRRPPLELEPSIAHLPVAARESFCYAPDTRTYRHRSGTTLQFLPITAIDISSTEVRRRVREGSSIRYLVPPEIERYVAERGLYGET